MDDMVTILCNLRNTQYCNQISSFPLPRFPLILIEIPPQRFQRKFKNKIYVIASLFRSIKATNRRSSALAFVNSHLP